MPYRPITLPGNRQAKTPRPVGELELHMRDTLSGLRELLLSTAPSRHYTGLEVLSIEPAEESKPLARPVTNQATGTDS